MTKLPLFRDEALSYRNISQYGTIILARPLSCRILAVFSVLFLALATLFCCTCKIAGTCTAPGIILSRDRLPTVEELKTILSEVGQLSAPNQPLASSADSRVGYQAVLYVSGNNASNVKLGNRVNIRYRAYPYQKFGQYHGVVKNIFATLVMPGEIAFFPARKKAAYRINVSLGQQFIQGNGKMQPLEPGMKFDANIELEKRTVGELLFERLVNLL